MRVVAALDKFKGTARSADAGEAVARAGVGAGWAVSVVALSDGGEGLLDVFGGATASTRVTGPLGDPVDAGWRLAGSHAVIESALASGLVLAGGASGNDPMAATSQGTGELIDAAVRSGATHVLVGLGGSACTDGGIAAIDALSAATIGLIGSGAVELIACCDVTTRYDDAARVFAPQKGASQRQIDELTTRLRRARNDLRQRFPIDIESMPGGGAAGGLGGALAAIGGTLRSGFDTVAARIGLSGTIARADLVITGEGRLDASSFDGKVVGGVSALAAAAGVPVMAIVGQLAPSFDAPFPVISLVDRFGARAATGSTLDCIERAARECLSTSSGRATSSG